MHLSLLVAALAAAGPAAAWPGMVPDGSASHAAHARFHSGDMARDLKRHAEAMAQQEARDNNAQVLKTRADGRALLGDLQHLRDDELTNVGRTIKKMLTRELHAADVGAQALARRQEQKRQEALAKREQGPGCKPKKKTSSSVATTSSEASSSSASSSATTLETSAISLIVVPSSSSLSSTSVSSSLSSSSVATTSSATLSTSSSATSTSSSATASATIPSCSVWSDLGNELLPLFQDASSGNGNGCNALARGCIRLGFHDAGAWNTSVSYGGADGSIALNAEELARSDNDGLADTVAQVQEWYKTWNAKAGVGMADLIQFAAIVATAACPLGPRVPFYAGRVDDSRAAVPGLLPGAYDAADSLVALFAAKTLSATDLVALVGAHSTSQQFVTDNATAGYSQDTTPGVWDVLFYDQTTAVEAPAGVYRFESDQNLAAYEETAQTWASFGGRGQGPWDQAYTDAYLRLSLLGVKNINNLLDCSSSVP